MSDYCLQLSYKLREHSLVVTTDARTNTLVADLLPLFKKHARIDWADDDELCTMYIHTAISRVEQYTEMPVFPAAYLWDMVDAYPTSEKTLLPFRNCVVAGEQSGFELLIAPKWITTPTVWPVTLQVGFEAGVKVPMDMKLAIYQLALALYEFRSNPEGVEMYAQQVMNGNLSRYVVPRV